MSALVASFLLAQGTFTKLDLPRRPPVGSSLRWAATTDAVLFAAAAVNVFVPSAVPSGVGRALRGTGRPADSLISTPGGLVTVE